MMIMIMIMIIIFLEEEGRKNGAKNNEECEKFELGDNTKHVYQQQTDAHMPS